MTSRSKRLALGLISILTLGGLAFGLGQTQLFKGQTALEFDALSDAIKGGIRQGILEDSQNLVDENQMRLTEAEDLATQAQEQDVTQDELRTYAETLNALVAESTEDAETLQSYIDAAQADLEEAIRLRQEAQNAYDSREAGLNLLRFFFNVELASLDARLTAASNLKEALEAGLNSDGYEGSETGNICLFWVSSFGQNPYRAPDQDCLDDVLAAMDTAEAVLLADDYLGKNYLVNTSRNDIIDLEEQAYLDARAISNRLSDLTVDLVNRGIGSTGADYSDLINEDQILNELQQDIDAARESETDSRNFLNQLISLQEDFGQISQEISSLANLINAMVLPSISASIDFNLKDWKNQALGGLTKGDLNVEYNGSPIADTDYSWTNEGEGNYTLSINDSYEGAYYTITVAPSAYVAQTLTNVQAYANPSTRQNLSFAASYTVDVLNEAGADITNASVSIGSTACTYNTDQYYCLVPLGTPALELSASAQGYNTFTRATASRTEASSPQVNLSLTMLRDTSLDTDGDGLSDVEEEALGTDPTKADTDGGGVNDKVEVDRGTDPLNAADDASYPAAPADPNTEFAYLVIEVTDEDEDPVQDLEEDNFEWDGPSDTADTFDEIDEGIYLFKLEDGEYDLKIETNDYSDEKLTNLDTFLDRDDAEDDPYKVTLELSDRGRILSDEDYKCTDHFKDITDDLLCRMRDAGIIEGVGGGYFGLTTITEAEALKTMLASRGYDEADGRALPAVPSHVKGYASGQWYDPWYRIAVKENIIRDFADPNNPIPRERYAVLAARTWKKELRGFDQDDIEFKDISVRDSYAYAVILMNQTEVDVPGKGDTPIIEGYPDGTFRPNNPIARKDAIYLLYRIQLAWEVELPIDTEGLDF